jgi:hypothetical protein
VGVERLGETLTISLTVIPGLDPGIHALAPFHPIDLILRKRAALSRRRAPEGTGASFETPAAQAPQDEVCVLETKTWMAATSPAMTR